MPSLRRRQQIVLLALAILAATVVAVALVERSTHQPHDALHTASIQVTRLSYEPYSTTNVTWDELSAIDARLPGVFHDAAINGTAGYLISEEEQDRYQDFFSRHPHGTVRLDGLLYDLDVVGS